MPARVAGLSLVLPASNESENLRLLLPRVKTALARLADRYEVIVVDDGSDDGTGATATELARELELPVRVVRHEQRQGYGPTVRDGLQAASLDYTAFMDADGQFDPADLERLLEPLSRVGMVGGWRRERHDPLFRHVISGVYNLLVRVLFRLPIRDANCALKVMRSDQLRELRLRTRSAVLNVELYREFQRRGWGIAQVPVPHHQRQHGRRLGARLKPILRALRDLGRLRLGL